MKLSIIEKAARLAVSAHKEQKRKGDQTPYIVHPFMVALKLAKHNFSETVIAAALVHDVLEDTDCSEEELRQVLGNELLEIVKAVTNDNTLSWEAKKRHYIETVRNGTEAAKAVSVADKIHNIETLLVAYEEQGVNLWQKFNRGRDQKIWFEEEVLKMLKETWQHPLIEEYERLINKEKKLK